MNYVLTLCLFSLCRCVEVQLTATAAPTPPAVVWVVVETERLSAEERDAAASSSPRKKLLNQPKTWTRRF